MKAPTNSKPSGSSSAGIGLSTAGSGTEGNGGTGGKVESRLRRGMTEPKFPSDREDKEELEVTAVSSSAFGLANLCPSVVAVFDEVWVLL